MDLYEWWIKLKHKLRLKKMYNLQHMMNLRDYLLRLHVGVELIPLSEALQSIPLIDQCKRHFGTENLQSWLHLDEDQLHYDWIFNDYQYVGQGALEVAMRCHAIIRGFNLYVSSAHPETFAFFQAREQAQRIAEYVSKTNKLPEDFEPQKVDYTKGREDDPINPKGINET